jgi:hypothetical protein
MFPRTQTCQFHVNAVSFTAHLPSVLLRAALDTPAKAASMHRPV